LGRHPKGHTYGKMSLNLLEAVPMTPSDTTSTSSSGSGQRNRSQINSGPSYRRDDGDSGFGRKRRYSETEVQPLGPIQIVS
jgi:hypothetical protein